jgi:glycosyltransferase involved in cell wall biosynthesis
VVRVLLDATAVPPERGGVGRYVDNLLPALRRCGVDVRVACRDDDAQHYATLSGGEPLVAPRALRRAPVRLAWEQVGLPLMVRRAAPDIVHSPHYTLPVAVRRPIVVTLHDATFFTDPGVHTAVKGPFFRAATRFALRRAAACVTPSQATADELVRVAHADPARLHVAHLGVDSTVFAPPSSAAVAAVRERLALRGDEQYIAFLGTHEPRKNLPELVRAWVSAFENSPQPPALVLAGGAGWDERLSAVADAVPAPLRLIRPGYLPLDQLAGLLGGADVVAYPSLGEGFGLPVLEAMACGAPVLTTRRLALPEVGGDAVEYTEPDAGSIAAALRRLVDDPERRRVLASRAIARASRFTWDACALAHLSAYEQAAASRRRSVRSAS